MEEKKGWKAELTDVLGRCVQSQDKNLWIANILNLVEQELDRAREEGRKELIKEIRESIKRNIKIDDTEEKHIKIDTDIVKILNDKEITKMFLDGEWGDYVDSDCRVSWGWYS